MIRLLPYLLEIGMLVYCLIDCAQTDSASVRNLPKVVWVILIVVLPVVGGIAWLVAGRPERRASTVPWPSTATAGFPEYERPRRSAPDDDPEFLAGMRRSDQTHEEMLKAWEAQLRERERKLERPDGEQEPRTEG
ncbi:membrane protein [Cellulomonas chitinilytica]|uniref:Membrane protein n=1 Tax=Cellulomonas chitinilytica TaxID=398759 RepID=A0A919NY40_9CELL|nr:PLDc N-terminal domain-containing protein [Cellulomonas chitinilytica]GIG19743.1 membrane protein [Cellulomonas chitinilytica]